MEIHPAIPSPSHPVTSRPGLPAEGERRLPVDSFEEFDVPDEFCTPGQVMTRDEVVRILSARDAEVRAHEDAHLRAAGTFAQGGPVFTTTRGPDGRHYAIGGKVSIDVSEISGDARATAAKMKQVHRAAMAPDSHHSAADLSVAAQALQNLARAEQEMQSHEAGADGFRLPRAYGRDESSPR